MRKKEKLNAIFWGLAVFGIMLVGFFNPAICAEPNNGQYQANPLSLSSMVRPNVMVVMDNSGSMMMFAYQAAYIAGTPYDGLFDPLANYVYNTGDQYFETTGSTPSGVLGVDWWEGKFLNWLCMRRVDISKNVLIGGQYVNSGGTHLTKGFTYVDWNPWNWQTVKSYDYYNDGTVENYTHASVLNLSPGPYFNVDIPSISAINFYIRVKVNARPTGVIQDMGSQVRFGLAIYSPVTTVQGGKIVIPIGSGATHNNDIVTAINDMRVDTNTPMGETFFSVLGYFKQDGTTGFDGPRYDATDYEISNAWDPYYAAGGTVHCMKSYVIFISDGEANNDSNINSTYRPTHDTSGTTNLNVYGEIGGANNYLDNVAYYAHVNDLKPLILGTQNLTLYTISLFGGGEALLRSAAKFGGFTDNNGNNVPDLQGEWDKDGNTIPDNFFAANSSAELKKALSDALVNILSQSSSGSAVSIISNNDQGEGTIIQAYYRSLRAATSPGDPDIKWLGYLHSFWLDDRFNLREDTGPQDQTLDNSQDKIITFFVDPIDGNVKLARYDVSPTDPYAMSGTSTIIAITDVKPLWDAGQKLAQRDPDNRTIFTGLDLNKDGVVFPGEKVDFLVTSNASLQPYLGVADSAFWAYLGATHADRSQNLIQWIRGEETGLTGADVRSRKIGSTVWKLGDIVDSSPVTVTNPLQRYDVLYGDMTFSAYYQYVNNTLQRESVVYVGANDGMLHAFTAGKFNRALNKYEKKVGYPEDIGDELWAYIPQAVLPHLKWLASKNYLHTYYVNMTPVVWDVQIFTPSATHPGGWGTILLCGLNMGGKDIPVTDDFGSGSETRTFSPSYFALDITNPHAPELLWERTYQGLGLSTSKPSIIKVADKWFAVFGSGPINYDGTSTQSARVFVVDLIDGAPHKDGANDWRFIDPSGMSGFMNSPTARDHQLDFSVDDVYFGESYYAGGEWNGKAWRLHIPVKDDEPNNWNFDYYFTAPGAPITAPISVGKCLTPQARVATYFGTGRYMGEDDKASTEQQYLMKVNDPYYNPSAGGLTTLVKNDLANLDGCATGADFVHGWYYPLTQNIKERSLTKPIVFGGVVIYSSFIPNQDLCGYGGDGYLWVANACGLCGPLIHVDELPPGNPSLNTTVLISTDGKKVSTLGRQPSSIGQQGTVMSQSGGVMQTNKINLPSVPRTKFFYWREN